MRRPPDAVTLRNSCRVVVGRLLEIDVCAGYRSVDDVDEMIRMMSEQFARQPEPTRFVIAADWRACQVLTPKVAERAVQMLAGSNPRVERSAILHESTQSTSVLQVLRLTREAENQHRRVFTDPIELKAWLGEVLSEPEAARVRALVDRKVIRTP